jgi:S-DNA-T family DNA segregation ATPase FtsK/SpoIIIE
VSRQHRPVSLNAVGAVLAGMWLGGMAYGWWLPAGVIVVVVAVCWRSPGWRCRLLAAAATAGRLAREIFLSQPPAPQPVVITVTEPTPGPAPAPAEKPGTSPRPDDVPAPPAVAAISRVFTEHGVDAVVSGWVRGPAVTRFEVTIAAGVKVGAVVRLVPDIAYATGCPAIRVLSPIPGRSAIGLELPNDKRDIITLPAALASAGMADPHPLRVPLGADLTGQIVTARIEDMPHVLVSGTTGSGKSSALNSLLCTLIGRVTPEQVRLLLIDPKRVEFVSYHGIPHLARPVITSAPEAVAALQWACTEMDHRYEVLAAAGKRNITEYNTTAGPGGRMPYLVIVVDELADLMMLAKTEVEQAVVRLTQLARAAGIHLVLATQRPSADVITGLIKANIPSRLAFTVASLTDSRVILDHKGAELLYGKGDALWLPLGASTPVRLQGVYTSDSDIAAAVTAARSHPPAPPLAGTLDRATVASTPKPAPDPALLAAAELVVASGHGSAGAIQRELRCGFARATALLAQLEAAGIVGPAAGPRKPREVLVTDPAEALARLHHQEGEH